MQLKKTKLDIYRQALDKIDRQIIQLAAERSELIKKIAKYKKDNNLEIQDKKREHEALNNLLNFGKKNHIEPLLIKNIFKVLIRFSKKNQLKILTQSHILTKRGKTDKI